MKKFFIYLFCCLAVPVYSTAACLMNHSAEQEVIIPIEKTGNNESENPRGIGFSSITCIYSNSRFAFYFNNSFENTTIIITNTTTGEQWYESTLFPTNSISISTSGSKGVYSISICTETDYYYGSFYK